MANKYNINTSSSKSFDVFVIKSENFGIRSTYLYLIII